MSEDTGEEAPFLVSISFTMSSKREKRLEAKKRKAAAFLEVARMNDEDRRGDNREEEEASPKRSKIAPPPPARLSDKPLLTGADYEALRAELRARKKALMCLPRSGDDEKDEGLLINGIFR